jgi:hypothetical protein
VTKWEDYRAKALECEERALNESRYEARVKFQESSSDAYENSAKRSVGTQECRYKTKALAGKLLNDVGADDSAFHPTRLQGWLHVSVSRGLGKSGQGAGLRSSRDRGPRAGVTCSTRPTPMRMRAPPVSSTKGTCFA